jgi:hypothetical protein
MKAHIFIFLVVLFNCGTDQIDRINRHYILENKTNHVLEMDLYLSYWPKGSEPSKYYVNGPGILRDGLSDNDAGHVISAFSALGADSVIVTYDGIKRQIYYASHFDGQLHSIPEVQKHLFVEESYEIESETLYRFTFTEEDYELAEFI